MFANFAVQYFVTCQSVHLTDRALKQLTDCAELQKVLNKCTSCCCFVGDWSCVLCISSHCAAGHCSSVPATAKCEYSVLNLFTCCHVSVLLTLWCWVWWHWVCKHAVVASSVV